MESRERKPNRLIGEKSPYLLQHAYNPVNWYPWGEEAFARAAAEDKLIFLSIGYATCHWCHVMERESFENEETAGLLNELFVPIKVDREERPDIDGIYLDALQAMGKQGGWPLNIFITPDQNPLYGGTYFPPVPSYGMASFKEVLQAVGNAWQGKRSSLLQVSLELKKNLALAHAERPDKGLPSPQCFDNAFQSWQKLYDGEDFGFSTDEVNKFPPSMALSFLLNYFSHRGNHDAIDMVEHTLSAMKRGGIYDQLGGGLSRYATDHSWLVPHFEKMLYDNSLFLHALTTCYQLSGRALYKKAAYDVIGYVQRDLTVPGGGIASAEDADSEGEEGKLYLWSLPEFRAMTGADSSWLEEFWHLTDHGHLDGQNILHEDIHAPLLTPEERWGAEQAETIRKNREKLLLKRNERPRPLRDDKVLTSWNCLYIRGLVHSGLVFDDAELIRRAESLHTFICEHLFSANGRLMRRYREGTDGILGYLSDYAELALASCELFRATSNLHYLQMAQRLTQDAIRLFRTDFGPFYETGSDAKELLRRTINGYDGVEPSGNSSLARTLCILSELGINREEYLQTAEGIFRHFKNELDRHPVSCPALLEAYLRFTSPPAQIVLIAERDNPELQQSLAWLHQSALPNATSIVVAPADISTMAAAIPILAGKTPRADFTVYLCREMTCLPPILSFKELKETV